MSKPRHTKRTASAKATPADRYARVADWLTSSIDQHKAYRQAVQAGEASTARAHLIEADRLRRQAHELDPEHGAPIWQSTAVSHPHAALVTFYAEQLAR